MNRRAWGIVLLVIMVWVACSWLAGVLFMSFALRRLSTAMPWTIYFYMFHYGHIPGIRRLLSIAWFGSCSFLASLMAHVLQRRPVSPHGNARWATERDVRKIGLRAENGILLGRFQNEFLVADGFEHALCFAPTRSGKGVGIVIPNLLNWPGSAIVHDIKGENFEQTSGFRSQHGQKVYFWNPGDPEGRTHCYNPLEFISNQAGQRINDIQKIAHLILPDQEFWSQEARTLFVGLALHLIEKAPLSFGLILRAVRGQGNFVEHIKRLLNFERHRMNPVAYMALNAFAQKADKEQSAVLSTLNAALELWANPLIDAATARSDFDLRRLKKERISIYVGVVPSNLHRLRPLMQVFYQQAIDFMIETKPDLKEEPHPVLFLMDEFSSLGRMPQFEEGIAYLAGYRVRLLMIIQDIPQLESKYQRSGMNVFMGNSKYRVTFAANNFETADLISRLLGTFGAVHETESESRQVGLMRQAPFHSKSKSHVARPLLLPQEVLQLSPEEEIVLVEGAPPVRAKKIRYFKEGVFKRRVLPPVLIPKVNPVPATVPVLYTVKPLSESEQNSALNTEPAPEEMSQSC